jgi:nucleolar protein 14
MSKVAKVQNKKKSTERKDNPFENRSQKVKFDVLGKKVIGRDVRLSHARSRAEQKRKNTLGIEFAARSKDNKFVDRRIGENDNNMSYEEKMLARFQKTRQKQLSKRSVYNIDEEDLTHMGQSLSTFDDFKDDYDSDDDDRGEIDEQIVDEYHFGGLMRKKEDGQEGRPKTKKEVMEEIIAKSKFYKAQKARAREERSQLTEKLDDDFTSIRELLSFRDKEADEEREGELPMFKDDTNVDEYDKLMRQMIFEPRAQPSNALRTEEQMALAERERLEQLERARLKRMNQEPEEHEEEESEEEAPAPVKSKRVSADDLGEEDYTNILPAGDEDSEENDVNSAEEDEGEQDGENEAMSDEASDSEHAGTSLFEQRGLSTLLPLSSLLNKHNKYTQITDLDATAEIPFTIGMAPSFKEFNQLMKNQSVVRQHTIIKRLRTCYHVSLLPENKEVMKHFYGYLIKRLMWCARQVPVQMSAIDILSVPLFELSQQFPDFAAYVARDFIIKMQLDLQNKLNKFEQDSSAEIEWVSLDQVLLLKMLANIWPVSDKRHVVVTPAVLMMANHLSRVPVTNTKTLLHMLLLADVFIHYTETAKRFVPEIFSFLLSVVHAFVVNNSTTQVPFQPLTFIAKTAVTVEPKQTQAKTPENNKNKKRKSDQKDDKPEQEEVVPPLDVSWLVRDSTPETAHGARLVKSVALSAAVHSLKTLCKITAESDYASGCVALLHTATKLLRAVPSLLPTPIMKMITATANLIAKSAAELEGKRNPLTLHETKPEPIKSLTPAFKEDEYNPGKLKDKSKEQREHKLLQRKYKAELKGAERELKKDSVFIERQRMDKWKQEQDDKQKKQKEIWRFLEDQQHEFKQEKKNKRKKTSDL